jgi:hypothetical protein
VSGATAQPDRALLEKLVQVKVAADLLVLSDEARGSLDRWLAFLPLDAGASLDMGMATSLLLDRGVWRVAGPTEAMLQPMAVAFSELGGDVAGIARLGELGQRVRPERLSSWLQLRGDAVDAGWSMPTAIDATIALDETPPSASREALARWLADEGIEALAGFERSLGPADYAGFWIPLPGITTGDALDGASRLMDALDLGDLPVDLRMVLGTDDDTQLLLNLWLIEQGVARFGVGIPDPNPAAVIALSMLLGVDQDDELAMVQASLTSSGPSYVLASISSGRFDVEVGWDVDTR